MAFWPEESAKTLKALEIQALNRRERNLNILERLVTLGVNISEQELLAEAGGSIVGRPHIASILLRRGVVRNKSEAFARFLGRDGAAYVPRELLSPLEGVRLLRSFNAVTAIAHPLLLRAPEKYLRGLITELAAAGLDALEAYHSEHSAEETRRVVDLAAAHGLLLCGGSDYHGDAKTGVFMGKGRGGLRIPTYLLDKLKERHQKIMNKG